MNNQAFEWFKKTIKNKFNKEIDQIDENSYLVDLGIDSLDLVEIQLEYENDFSVEVPETTKEIRTVKDLLEILP